MWIVVSVVESGNAPMSAASFITRLNQRVPIKCASSRNLLIRRPRGTATNITPVPTLRPSSRRPERGAQRSSRADEPSGLGKAHILDQDAESLRRMNSVHMTTARVETAGKILPDYPQGCVPASSTTAISPC